MKKTIFTPVEVTYSTFWRSEMLLFETHFLINSKLNIFIFNMLKLFLGIHIQRKTFDFTID
jgi:hypothetical protein